MTGQQAFKKLRAAGWVLVKRGGNHTLMARDGQTTVVPFGSLSPRAESSLRRLLLQRPTSGDKFTAEGNRR
jgi:predicted RNA binding protein YcfA (HicA-like mRNA interferase family)